MTGCSAIPCVDRPLAVVMPSGAKPVQAKLGAKKKKALRVTQEATAVANRLLAQFTQ